MRIAIVNDTPMVLESLRRIIDSAPEHNVAWLAENGELAVEACQKDIPDLILMDIIMPVMNGVDACEIITQESPCAILIVTSSISDNATLVFNAMGKGALDAVNTPVLNPEHPDYSADNLLNKIKIIGKLISPTKSAPLTTSINTKNKKTSKNNIHLLAIGSSTGGPSALVSLLHELPSSFSSAIVIVQHIDQQFCPGLIEWINEQVALPVSMAKESEALLAGHIYISAGDNHLSLDENQCFHYSKEPSNYPYVPSVNVFFNSIAENWQGNVCGMLLTGMGKDGAEGLLALRKQGYLTIAQNKDSCAVYGMPKAAAELNAAKYILPLEEISKKLINDLN